MDHKFKVGSSVRLKRPPSDRSAVERYEVIRLVPADVDGVPAYRIKDAAGQERAARETDIDHG